jgi:hypothetical protein
MENRDEQYQAKQGRRVRANSQRKTQDLPDAFSGVRSYIRGRRVPAGATRNILAGARATIANLTCADTGRPEGMETQKHRSLGSHIRRTPLPILGISITDDGKTLIGKNGQHLPWFDGGGEADVYLNEAFGTVYKVFPIGNNGAAGDVYFVNERGRLESRLSQNPRDLIDKIYLINAIGGVPTEIPGILPTGELVVKQPYGWREELLSHEERYAVNDRASLSFVTPDIVPLDVFDSIYVTQTPVGAFLIGDLHEGNYLRNAQHSGRILDLVTMRVTSDTIESFPKLKNFLDEEIKSGSSLL